MNIRIALLLLLVVSPAVDGQQPTAPQGLKIVVIEGEDAVNVIQQKTAVRPVIEVRDRNNLPVAGVSVTFAIQGGNVATFAGGAQTFTVVTNAAGQAAAAAINPLSSGLMQIQVQAAFQGQTVLATIAQTNVMTVAQAAAAGGAASGSGSAGASGSAGGGGGLSNTVLVGVGGAAAAGAVVAVAVGRDEPPSGPMIGINVTPNSSGVRDITRFAFSRTGGSLSSPEYQWNLGDGVTANGPTTTHQYGVEGNFTVTLQASAAGLRGNDSVALFPVSPLLFEGNRAGLGQTLEILNDDR